MYKLSAGLAAGALLAFASSANATTLLADFELNGSLVNMAASGSAVTLTNNGGTLDATGITFGQNDGPSLSGLSPTSTYTISMAFTLDSLTGTGTSYVKLIDFSGLTSDAGYYSYAGEFTAYPLGFSGATNFTAGQPVVLTVSRDASGTVAAYIGDTLIYDKSDPADTSNTAITSDPLTFLTDDTVTGQHESSSGFIDYIRVYDTAITPDQATGAGGVPEPATWTMMIVGIGLAGLMLRRRQAPSLA